MYEEFTVAFCKIKDSVFVFIFISFIVVVEDIREKVYIFPPNL